MTKREFLDQLKKIGESQKSFYEKTGKTSSLSGYTLEQDLPITYEKLLELLKELNNKNKIIEALNTAISQK
jgi:hypothetical protein